MKVQAIAALALPALLIGCAGSPAAVSMMKAEQLAAAPAEDLCNAIAVMNVAAARAELGRRNALTQEEWKLANAKSVRVGMRELAAICSWGGPDEINRTTTAGGTREQWVYCAHGQRHCIEASYLYLENGRVVAIQD